jgi:hypothetical protein
LSWAGDVTPASARHLRASADRVSDDHARQPKNARFSFTATLRTFCLDALIDIDGQHSTR